MNMNEFLTISDLCQRLQLSRSALLDLRRDDMSFPAPVRVGRALRWRPEDLAAWREALPAAPRVRGGEYGEAA